MFRITRIYVSDICAGGNILQQACFPIADLGIAREPDDSSDHGVIFAVNGTCKTTLISFLLSTFYPDKKRFVQHLQSGGDKTLEQYLVPGRPAVILIELAVPRQETLFTDEPAQRLVIGQMLYTHREPSKPIIRYFFQAHSPELFEQVQENWVMLCDGPKPLSAVREFILPRVAATEVQKEWLERLERIGLDPWLVDRQIDFAKSEGGIKDAFRFRSEAEFLSFFLGCVTDMDFALELRKTTLVNMEKMRGRPRKKARLEAVLHLQTRLTDFEPAAIQCQTALAQNTLYKTALEEAAFLVEKALPRAAAQKEKTRTDLSRAEQEHQTARTGLGVNQANQLKARAYSLALDKTRLQDHARTLENAINAAEQDLNTLAAADIISRISLCKGQLTDKTQALAASGSELLPLRKAADLRAAEYHACLTHLKTDIGRKLESAKTKKKTVQKELDNCRRDLKDTEGQIRAKQTENSRLSSRLEMAMEAQTALGASPAEPVSAIRERLGMAMNQTLKDISMARDKHRELKASQDQERRIRENLAGQEARDKAALDLACERRDKERSRREQLLADPRIQSVAGSDTFDPTNAGHVSGLSRAIERKTRQIAAKEKENRALDSELKRLDEVHTLAVDEDTHRLISHYRDQGIAPAEIRAFPEYLASLDLGADATAEFIHRDPARFTGILAMNPGVMERIMAIAPPRWLRRPVVVSLPVSRITEVEEIPHHRIFPPDTAIYTREGAGRLRQTLAGQKETLEQDLLDLEAEKQAIVSSMNTLKNYRESYPEPSRVQQLDLDLTLAENTLKKTRQEISASLERIMGIENRMTRCQDRINELGENKVRQESRLSQVRQWLKQYGEWETWTQNTRENEQAVRKLGAGLKELSARAQILEKNLSAAGLKIPALEKDLARLDELALDVPCPAGIPLEAPLSDMDPGAIKRLYEQARNNLERMSTELGMAALEQETRELGNRLAELNNEMGRFTSGHSFDPAAAELWSKRNLTDRQRQRETLTARVQETTREKMRAQAKAQTSEEGEKQAQDQLDRLEKKGIMPGLHRSELEALSPEAVTQTLIPGLSDRQQELETLLEETDVCIRHSRERLEADTEWVNRLENLKARAGDAPKIPPGETDPDWPDLCHPQDRLAHCRDMEKRIKQIVKDLKEGETQARQLERIRDAKFRELAAWIRQSDFEVIIPTLVDSLKEHDAQSLSESCRDLIQNCSAVAATLEGDLSRSRTLMETHVSLLLEHAKDCYQKLTSATQVTIPDLVFTYGGKPILRASARLDFNRFAKAYKDALENWMEERIQTGLCPQVNPTAGNPLGADLLYRLLEVEAKKTFNIRLLKCDDTARNYEPVGRDLGSGGEALTTSVLLYALLVSMRTRRFKGGVRPMPGFLILDNPLGVCNRPDFLDAQLKVADALGVQCIYFTGINDTGSIELFEHRIVIQKAGSQLTIDSRPFERLSTVQIHVEA